jgi:hypothetical protein
MVSSYEHGDDGKCDNDLRPACRWIQTSTHRSNRAIGRISKAGHQMGVLMEGKPTDGYWLRIGERAVQVLACELRDDVTEQQRKHIAEYLGSIMDNAYDMGIKLGELSAKYKTKSNET